MSEVNKHKPGAFSWIELATTDQNAAKAFYTSLFGWTFRDSPMGPNDFYTMFSLKDRIAAAAYTQRGDEQALHIPPHWNLYINVVSADETAKRAGELGAKVLVSPFDVFTFGRMTVLQDPTGAVFSAWQAREHPGIGIKDEPGSLCWADLNTPDPQSAATFYSRLFGWEMEGSQHGHDYLHIKNGGDYIGGIPPIAHQNANAPPHWMIYILISDCDASTEKAKQLGARIYREPMTMENVGRLTVLADPQGAVSALFERHRR
jgi:predicted enzyme related to lactoylglutathione lyase